MPKFKKAKYWESGAVEMECPHCGNMECEEGFAYPDLEDVYQCERCSKKYQLRYKAEN